MVPCVVFCERSRKPEIVHARGAESELIVRQQGEYNGAHTSMGYSDVQDHGMLSPPCPYSQDPGLAPGGQSVPALEALQTDMRDIPHTTLAGVHEERAQGLRIMSSAPHSAGVGD